MALAAPVGQVQASEGTPRSAGIVWWTGVRVCTARPTAANKASNPTRATATAGRGRCSQAPAATAKVKAKTVLPAGARAVEKNHGQREEVTPPSLSGLCR